ncbi:MAG: hypothetical protein RBU37_12505 [Myxococcota bacterium]|nr:hypothetical protein [Myxococcota bacterium]
MNENPEQLFEQVADYLDGLLDTEQSRAFERALIDPSLQQALAIELSLRDLMADFPPNEAPEGLVSRIEASLGLVEDDEGATALWRAALRRWGRLSTMGPGFAVEGLRAATAGAEALLPYSEPAEPSAVVAPSAVERLERSAKQLGALRSTLQQGQRLVGTTRRLFGGTERKPERPWWRRLLGRGE